MSTTTVRVKILELGGKRWAILPERDYRRLAAGAATKCPALPQADDQGLFPAVEYARASPARRIIHARRAAGLSQAELARQARIRPETLNRIEKRKTTPDPAAIAKIHRALPAARTTPK